MNMVSKIFKIGMLLLVVLSFSSCGWFFDIFSEKDFKDDTNIINFRMRNLTGEHIIIKSKINLNCVDCFSQIDKYYYRSIINDSISIFHQSRTIENYEGNKFELLYHNAVDDTVFIYSQDSVLLKVWTEGNRNLEGKQLFNESYWTKKSWTDDYHIYTEYTFDLTPEDIQK